MGSLIRESQNVQYVDANNGDRGKDNVYLVWVDGLTLIGGFRRLFPPFSTRPPYSWGCSNPLNVHKILDADLLSWRSPYSALHRRGAKRLGVSLCHGSYTGAYHDTLVYLLCDVSFASPSSYPLNNGRYTPYGRPYWCLYASILNILTIILSSAN
jgi:hypothetical protein